MTTAINLNDLAQEIAEREGKKESVNIAQIKEVLSITLDILATKPAKDLFELFASRGEEREG